MNPESLPPLLTTAEVAACLNLHHVTLNKDRTNGNSLGIPYIRIGKSVRYRPSDVTAWIEKHRVA